MPRVDWTVVNMPWKDSEDGTPGFESYAEVGMMVELEDGRRFLLGDCDIAGREPYDDSHMRAFADSAIIARYTEVDLPPPVQAEKLLDQLEAVLAEDPYDAAEADRIRTELRTRWPYELHAPLWIMPIDFAAHRREMLKKIRAQTSKPQPSEINS